MGPQYESSWIWSNGRSSQSQGVKIIHKGALLCPVSETKLWRELQNTDLVPRVRDWREETLGTKISTIQTKQTRKNSVRQKPHITWSTWKGNSSSNHCKCATQHKKSAQRLNINTPPWLCISANHQLPPDPPSVKSNVTRQGIEPYTS